MKKRIELQKGEENRPLKESAVKIKNMLERG